MKKTLALIITIILSIPLLITTSIYANYDGVNVNNNIKITLSGLSSEVINPEWDKVTTASVLDDSFSHWEENGVLVSFNKDYKFSSLYNRNLVSKSVTNVEKFSFLNQTEIINYRTDAKYKTYISQFELYNGDVYIEHGYVMNGEHIVSKTLASETTNEFLVSINSENWEMEKAFIKVVKNGNTRYIYSDEYSIDDNGNNNGGNGGNNLNDNTDNNSISDIILDFINENSIFIVFAFVIIFGTLSFRSLIKKERSY